MLLGVSHIPTALYGVVVENPEMRSGLGLTKSSHIPSPTSSQTHRSRDHVVLNYLLTRELSLVGALSRTFQRTRARHVLRISMSGDPDLGSRSRFCSPKRTLHKHLISQKAVFAKDLVG